MFYDVMEKSWKAREFYFIFLRKFKKKWHYVALLTLIRKFERRQKAEAFNCGVW